VIDTERAGIIARMDPDKQKRVIAAGMTEFRKGYQKASTDNIAGKAGISKGLLFHYFGSKKVLLWYLLSVALSVIRTGYTEQIDRCETDLLNRLLQAAYLKLELSAEHPAVFAFVEKIYFSDEPECADARDWLRDNVAPDWPDDEFSLRGISLDHFRSDIDPRVAVEAVRYTLSGYASNALSDFETTGAFWENADRIMTGMQKYIELFRKTFYRASKGS